MIAEAGGGRGIRTLDTVACIHAFQACAFSHSATPPYQSRRIADGAGRTNVRTARTIISNPAIATAGGRATINAANFTRAGPAGRAGRISDRGPFTGKIPGNTRGNAGKL